MAQEVQREDLILLIPAYVLSQLQAGFEIGFLIALPFLIIDLIVATLKLEDVTPEQMADDEPLIGSGLNLDSIDALELVLAIEKEFGVKIGSSEDAADVGVREPAGCARPGPPRWRAAAAAG